MNHHAGLAATRIGFSGRVRRLSLALAAAAALAGCDPDRPPTPADVAIVPVHAAVLLTAPVSLPLIYGIAAATGSGP